MRLYWRAWLKKLFKDDSERAVMRAELESRLGVDGGGGGGGSKERASREDDDDDENEDGGVVVLEDDEEGASGAEEGHHGVRHPYPREIRMTLLDWLRRHRHHPFVTSQDEFRQLKEATGLNKSQIKVGLFWRPCNRINISNLLDKLNYQLVNQSIN